MTATSNRKVTQRMKVRFRLLIFLGFSLAAATNAESSETDEQLYDQHIKPLLIRKCVPCHGALKQEADLRLDTVASMIERGVVSPNDSESSEVMQRIHSTNPDIQMPPEGEPLTETEILQIARWIDQGALGPPDEVPQANPIDHWAFQQISPPELPNDLTAHPVDHFITKALRREGLKLSPAADPISLCRRLYLDLHGLPPTPQQVDAFSNRMRQNTELAVKELIDSLLSSPRYGERWAQHWLDLVRYADTHGFEVNTPRENAWPYRDYVIRSFNENQPFDEFVKQQLSGDQLGNDAATGFLVAAPVLLPGQIGKDDASKRLARQDSLDEIIVGTSASFLGLSVGCARCHDHKFDPISQQDYYSFQAFFSGVRYGDRAYEDERHEQRQMEAEELSQEIESLRLDLSHLSPKAFVGETLIIDDEDAERTSSLSEKNGYGTNPSGEMRGYLNDAGDVSRFGNLSQGRYTWWDNQPGTDVFTWNPKAEGNYRVWISWGTHGSGVHTRDARYVLDSDGDLTTKADQRQIAIADQYYFSGQSEGTTEKKPLWSGLLNAGVHTFNPQSRLILRGGDTGTGITADVLVLQEATQSNTHLPRLRIPVSAKRNRETFKPARAKYVRFTSLETIDQNLHQPCIDEIEIYSMNQPSVNLALAAKGVIATSSGNYSETSKHQLKHINDGAYGNSRSWISNQLGEGWVQLELPKATLIDRIIWGRDRQEKFKDRLAVKYRIEISDDGNDWTTIASSKDRLPLGTPNNEFNGISQQSPQQGQVDLVAKVNRLRELEERQKKLRTPSMVYAGTFSKPESTHLLNRGDPEQPQEIVTPKTPSILTGVALSERSSDTDRRSALATWIVDPTHPLTARVITNRIWQFHFGTGIVDTPSDFGMNGSVPSHPKLLDWLANELIQSGWSINHLHHLILSSKTYRQSSRVREEGIALDRNCRLLWRFPNRRLEAEAIRDSVLSVTGELNLKMGGPGFNFFKTRGGLTGFPPLEKETREELRRTIYAHKIRMEPIPVFGAFDCPDAGQPSPKRGQSTTAIQALNLFNSRFIQDRSTAFANRIMAGEEKKIPEQVNKAFRLALCREPSKTEIPSAMKLVQDHGLASLCRVLLNSNEFLFIP